MRLPKRSITLLLVILLSIAAFGESAGSLYKKGKKAEARQDYIQAFEFYRQAYDMKPEELAYRISYQRTRFLASAQHVKKGEDLVDKGNLQAALDEFQTAADIDPSNMVAQQWVQRTKAMMQAAPPGTGAMQQVTPLNRPESAISRRLRQAAGPIELAPVSSQPITLSITNDSRTIYETIGKLAGINVLFDPDYTSRRIHLELNGVSLQEALDILAFQSNTFWRPVTRNTIFIAANTKAKRNELDQNVLKTFYLSNATTATDLQDVVNTVRQILEMPKVIQVASQNAIVARGTPDQIALVQKIIDDIDKAKPEVIVEVAVMQVRRDRLRDMGIRPPTSASIAIQPATTTTTTGTTNTNTTTTTTTNNGVSLNTLGSLNANDFNVTIPAATVNFLLTDNNSKLIQNPQIRALDGQKASLKIGDRVPIATGSFGGFGAGTIAANGLVNTQFQYIDVGVNIDITPHVHEDRTVSLKMVLDVSSVTGSSDIGGIKQPIISQRKVEHDIRLREGEVNLLGGIFEESEVKNLSGFPFLSKLPFLKYLFSEESNEKVENEIVFVLVPHIVRAPEYSDLNLRPIDVGTGTQIDLRRVPESPAGGGLTEPATQRPLPQSQAQPMQQMPAGSMANQPQQPGQTPPVQQTSSPPQTGEETKPSPSTPAIPGQATVHIEPSLTTQAVGGTFTVNVMVSGVQDLYSAPMQINYDPKVLQFVNISNGEMMSRDGQPVALTHREDPASGLIQANATRPPSSGGISGEGVLYAITFQAKQPGTSSISISHPSLRTSQMQPIAATSTAAQVNVR